MALIYIILYFFERIQQPDCFLLYTLDTPSFSSSYSLVALREAETMYIIALLTMIINCILKERFIKTKWLLTVLSALSLFVAIFCSPL